MSIAAGFFGGLADNIKDKREFIRSRVEEDRMYLRQQGLQRQAQVAEQKTRYQMATEQLLRVNGVDRNRVLAALEADPNGVLDLAGRDLTSAAEINTVLDLYEGTEASGTLSDILGRVMPAFAELPKDADPTTVNRTGVAAWLGLDTQNELNEQVYGAQIVGGMTGDQILASMNIPVVATGTGARGMNYAAIDPAEKLSSAERTYFYDEIAQGYDEKLDAEIATLRAQEAGASMEEKQQFMERIEKLEELKKGPVSTRLPLLMQEFGVDDNSRRYFELYGERLFDPTFGFNPNLMEQFTVTPEDNTNNAIPTDNNNTPPPPEVEEPFDVELESAASDEDINAVVTNFFETNPESTEVKVKDADGNIVVIQRAVEEPRSRDNRGTGGPSLGEIFGRDYEGSPRGSGGRTAQETGLTTSERPTARPDGAVSIANQTSAFELVDRINGGTNDPTNLKGRIAEAVQTEDRGQRNAMIQALIVDIQRNWTQSPNTDALLTQLMKAMES